MTEQQATFVESYLADHVHDMDSQEEVQAQAEEAMRLFKDNRKYDLDGAELDCLRVSLNHFNSFLEGLRSHIDWDTLEYGNEADLLNHALNKIFKDESIKHELFVPLSTMIKGILIPDDIDPLITCTENLTHFIEAADKEKEKKKLEDLKKCYVQRWVEVVDLSVLMELGRQQKLKEVEDFDLQQVIEAIQDLEVDIDFKDSDTQGEL